MTLSFTNFKTKLVVFFVSLFVLVQIITNTAVYITTKNNLENQAVSNLTFSGQAIRRAVDQRNQELSAAAELLSRDFGFREAVATKDTPTIISALQNLTTRIDTDRAFIVSMDQKVLAQYGTEERMDLSVRQDKALFPPEVFAAVEKKGEASGFIQIDGVIYEIVILPVLAPTPIAWMVLGIEINKAYLDDIKQTLPVGLEISIVHHQENSEVLLAADTFSLANEFENTFLPDLTDIKSAEVFQQNITSQRYMSLTLPLQSVTSRHTIYAVVHYSLDVVFSPFKPLMITLAGVLLAGMIAFIYESFVIARSVTRPLQELRTAAVNISKGVYQPLNDLHQNDEFGDLAASFNKMIEDIDIREQKITFQAEHDLETGLPNRLKFETVLDQLIAENPPGEAGSQNIDVFILTFQSIAEVRNSLGYSVAETLISQMGTHISATLPAADVFFARLNSISFILALREPVEDRLHTMLTLLKSFDKPFICGDYNIDMTVQIGGATYPEHGKTAADLIQKTHIAISQSSGTAHHYGIYNAEKDTQDTQKLSLMGDLRASMNKNEVFFHYQPKIDLKTGRMTHVEALMRWIHPERGFVAPDDFILLAEQTGHIHALTAWGLEQAIDACARWREAGYRLKMAMNLSAKDLANRQLPDQIQRLMTEKRVSAEWMVFEVTESAVMQEPEIVLDTLNRMSDLGLTLSIDDYGTGYSSLSYLKELPVSELKIDKSFVLSLATNKNDQILVRSTIDLAHNLGLKVTAEGVEDQASAELLKAYGCDVGQGYYFSRPVSEEDLLSYYREQRQAS
ncbi:EAL domain-containing protein [Paremcibacter congregatus]|uniref:EAL domain-containing protein n=1 Tax=Paremcibacter congregatus TaxID=2043170 RepID=UPI003A93C26F|tara:strand:- start:1165 stop:3555 length:2391 start_codon:yes stop_codon:yes gene_type:complete